MEFPPVDPLSATARPHNFPLRFKSFTSLRHFVCAVERPVAVNVTQPAKLLSKTKNGELSSITNASQSESPLTQHRSFSKLELVESRCYAPEMYLTRHPLNLGLRRLRS